MDNSGLSVAIPSASVAGGHLLAWRPCRLIVVLSDPQLSGTTTLVVVPMDNPPAAEGRVPECGP